MAGSVLHRDQKCRYVDDIKLVGMTYAHFIRSMAMACMRALGGASA